MQAGMAVQAAHHITASTYPPSPPRMHAGRHFRVQRVISSVFGPRSSCPRLGPRLSTHSMILSWTSTGCSFEKLVPVAVQRLAVGAEPFCMPCAERASRVDRDFLS